MHIILSLHNIYSNHNDDIPVYFKSKHVDHMIIHQKLIQYVRLQILFQTVYLDCQIYVLFHAP